MMALLRRCFICVMLLSGISGNAAMAQIAAPVCLRPRGINALESSGAELERSGVSIQLFGSLQVGKPEFIRCMD